MLIDSGDPIYGGGGGYGGGTGGGGGTGDPPIEGGSDPTHPPHWIPGPNGWWEFWNGVWRWVSEPVPRAQMLNP